LTGGARGLDRHVNVDELVVDGGVSIPVREIGDA
jgi:hypothetical protein